MASSPAVALLAVGVARMISVPVFLSLFLMGAAIAFFDSRKSLAYTNLPEGHWLLPIILFVITGASLPWRDFTLITGLQAVGLLMVRAAAKLLGVLSEGHSDLEQPKLALVGLGIQPLSAAAVFMTMELAALYPEFGRATLALPLFAAAIMEFIGLILCKRAFVEAGEASEKQTRNGGIG